VPDKTKAVHRVLNCIPSRDPEKDWRFENAAAAGIVAAKRLPPAVDLRDPSWWPVGDQRETGSCVGWATADGVLRWHFAEAGRIAKSEMIAPRFIWMAAKETDIYTSYASTFLELGEKGEKGEKGDTSPISSKSRVKGSSQDPSPVPPGVRLTRAADCPKR